MKKFMLFLAAAVAMVGCNDAIEEVTPSVEVEGTKVSVNLSLNDASTRVDLADDGAQGYLTTWTEDDKIIAWADGTSGWFDKQTYLSDDNKSASFEGSFFDDPAADDDVRFVYPYNEDETFADNAYVVSVANQESYGSSDLTTLRTTTHMVSDAIKYSEIVEGVVASPAMRHVGAALDLNMYLADATDYTLTSFTVTGMPIEATIDLTKSYDEADFITVGETGTIAVDALVSADDRSVFSTTLNILPCEVSNLTIEATFVDADYAEHKASKIITSENTATYARATRNTLNVILEEVEAPENVTITPQEVAAYFGIGEKTNIGQNKVYTEGYAVLTFIKDGSTPTRTWTGCTDFRVYKTGTFSISSEYEIEKIEFAGDSKDLSDLSVDNGNYTSYKYKCEWTGKSKSVTFTASDTTIIDGIDIYFVGGVVAPVVPTITGLSTESLSFTAAGGDGYSYIKGDDIDDATFEHDYTGEQFDIAFDGNKVTVTANENTTTEAIEETVTITAKDGTGSATLTLSQAAPIVFDGEVMTLNSDSGSIGDYTSSSNTCSGTMFLHSAQFTLNDIYNYNSCIALKKESGYLYNNSEFVELSQIVVTYQSGSAKAVVSVGAKPNPSTVATATETGDICTYDITDGSTFFKFANISNSFVNIKSIQIYYESLGETVIPTEFTGLNPAALSFAYDATEAQTVTIEGTNIAGAKSIAVDCESDYFTVDYTAGNNYFEVSVKDANNSVAPYSATVKVTVDDVVKTLEVLQKTSQKSETLVATLEASDFGYGYQTKNLTVDNVDFYCNKVGYYTAEQIQMNTKASVNSYFYNTSAITGLSKVVVTLIDDKNGDIDVFAGENKNPESSANVTKSENGDTAVYTITAGSSEFICVKPHSGATYVSKIEIYAVQ